MVKDRSAPILVGLAAAFAAAVIGAGWQVATRAGVTTALAPIDLAVLRYCVPALILLPLLLRHGLWPVATSKRLFAFLFIGAGLPFGILAMAGARFAPVAHMGALLPGTMPVFTALLAAILLGDRLTMRRVVGFVVIAFGVASVAGHALSDAGAGTWLGDAFFLAAAMLWAIYTVAFRLSGLAPWHSTALLSVASAAAALPIWLWSGPDRLLAAPLLDVGTQILAQGVLSGLGGMWTYALAIRQLGPQRAALSGALVPALSTVGGAFVLAEYPEPLVLAGVAATMVGVAVASLPPRAPQVIGRNP